MWHMVCIAEGSTELSSSINILVGTHTVTCLTVEVIEEFQILPVYLRLNILRDAV